MKSATCASAAALLGALALTQPARADTQVAGPWIAAMGGLDASELPDKDGPEAMMGVAVGHNWLRGRWLLGVEAEFGTSNANKRYLNYRAPGDSIEVHYGRDILLNLRAGRRLGERFVVYGKAGYANTALRVRYNGPPQPKPPFARDGTIFGFTVGGGVEYHLASRWLVKTEYRYANFHDGLYRHQGAVGVGLQF